MLGFVNTPWYLLSISRHSGWSSLLRCIVGHAAFKSEHYVLHMDSISLSWSLVLLPVALKQSPQCCQDDCRIYFSPLPHWSAPLMATCMLPQKGLLCPQHLQNPGAFCSHTGTAPSLIPTAHRITGAAARGGFSPSIGTQEKFSTFETYCQLFL